MRAVFLSSLILLASCSEPAQPPLAVPATTLAGLYERAGAGGAADRICLTGTGPTRFGLVTASTGAGACTAKGEASTQGTTVDLRIEGAPLCELTATTTAAGLTLNAPRGEDCAYYCGGNATIAAGDFTKAGTSAADVRKVVDIAGDPLC